MYKFLKLTLYDSLKGYAEVSREIRDADQEGGDER